MFCSKCGKLVAETDSFCMGCGNKLSPPEYANQPIDDNPYKEIILDEIKSESQETTSAFPEKDDKGKEAEIAGINEPEATTPVSEFPNPVEDSFVSSYYNNNTVEKKKEPEQVYHPTNQYENGRVTEIVPPSDFVADGMNPKPLTVDFGKKALILCIIIILLLSVTSGVFAGLYYSTVAKQNSSKTKNTKTQNGGFQQNNSIVKEMEYLKW